MNISNRKTNIIAGVMIVFLFLISFFSILGDTFTYDETAHIGAGYSYLTQRDMRLNPEHPPLIKNLAAFPLVFLNLNFPNDSPNWIQNEPPRWWVQFDFANNFLYESGNNPDLILILGRIMMIFLLILLGYLTFHFARRRFGNLGALIALFLFCFSPTFIAHGRLTNTDLGAAFGAVLSTYFWIKFLENPRKKNVIFAGLAFGIALVLKFSLILLVPFFGIITVIYSILKGIEEKRYIHNFLKYTGLALIAGIIGMIFIVWPIYQYHVHGYPPERQVRDAEFHLETFGNREMVNAVVWMSDKPILRPFAQYFLGLFMVLQRADGGNTTYFLGEVSATAWKTYFPIIYAIKEPITLHILSIIAILYLSVKIKLFSLKKWFLLLKKYFPEFSMIVFMIIYWNTSINANLNIGVRHLLPVFPFTFILVGGIIGKLIKPPAFKLKCAALSALILFQLISVLSVYPHFIAYYNELIGGPEKGYIYAVDSNLDWGQDLKRLKKWLDQNQIDKVYIDYFGGGNNSYYLGEENYERWDRKKSYSDFPKGNYLAVSVNQLQGGRGFPVKGFEQDTSYYLWLYNYKPVTKIGHSIFIYFID